MSDFALLIDAHLAAYADPDASRRDAVLQRIWAMDGQLIDPPMSAAGLARISRQAEQLLAQFPGHRFVRHSGIDSHHGMARYAWQLLDPAGGVALEGLDVAQIDLEGRLTRVTGFFGPLPAIEPAS